MIQNISKKLCTGCGACEQICPQKCISMTVDYDGFLYPTIGKECIKCNLCIKTCPLNSYINKRSDSEKAFVGYNKDDAIRSKSSSGGMFSLLAKKVISDNGVVFGAGFETNKTVSHYKVEYDDDHLEDLYGSKYIQSKIGTTYSETKKALQSGRKVLFSGTPCQIIGLKSFLNTEWDSLITVDLMCHGVCSPLLFELYLKDKEKEFGGKAENILFRKKSKGWKAFEMEIAFNNNTLYTKEHHQDLFMRFFLTNVALRYSCYHCMAKEKGSCADITIGDAWGIERIMPEMDDDKGTSLIITRTERGIQTLNDIRESMSIKEVDLASILQFHSEYNNSVKPAAMRPSFYKKIDKGYSIHDLQRLTSTPTVTERLMNRIWKLLEDYRCDE